MDRQQENSACGTGYPLIRERSIGPYVLIAQDLLNTLGFNTSGLDGIFGPNTKKATIDFQKKFNLVADGIIGCSTWIELTSHGVGIGRASTTVD